MGVIHVFLFNQFFLIYTKFYDISRRNLLCLSVLTILIRFAELEPESEVFGWSWRFLGVVGVGFLTTLGVGVGFFCPNPTPDV